MSEELDHGGREARGIAAERAGGRGGVGQDIFLRGGL